jgi:hypothetical protein
MRARLQAMFVVAAALSLAGCTQGGGASSWRPPFLSWGKPAAAPSEGEILASDEETAPVQQAQKPERRSPLFSD